jgi:hypothetical protein
VTTKPPSPLAVDVDEARVTLGGIGRTKFYREVAAGRIRVFKVGTRTFVPVAELERYIRERLAESEPQAAA